MAEEKDISLYMAGGSKIFRQMERLTTKQEKVANQQQEIINENLRDKAQSVSNIKRIATTQGGTPLTTQNIASVLSTIATTVTNRINQMSINTTKQFLPVDSQLKQINDLLTSNYEGDIDKGFELIDRLQTRLGVDLSKYSKEIGDAVQKLYDMNKQRKEDRAEAKRIQVEKTEELTRERDILRERGINTYVNIKEGKLELKSKKEERLELKRIKQEERDIQKEQKALQDEYKQLRKEDKIDQEAQKAYLEKEDKISTRKMLLEKDKEKAGLKPTERVSGPLDQTVGEAFRQIKSFGKEITQLGGDLFKGFGKLAGMVGRVAMGFFALLLPLIKFVLIAIGIGVVIYTLYKVIKSVIDFFANIFDSISKIWPFSLLKSDDKKNEEIGDPNKTAVPGQEDKQPPQYETDIQKRTGQGQMVNRNEIDGETVADRKAFDTGRESDALKILPINAEGGEDRRSINQMTRNVRSQNLNQMSVENQALNELKPVNNTVVAPNISNSNVNASNTQVSSMEPTNFDRSFINLNSVPV
jgi:hypothetical protein